MLHYLAKKHQYSYRNASIRCGICWRPCHLHTATLDHRVKGQHSVTVTWPLLLRCALQSLDVFGPSVTTVIIYEETPLHVAANGVINPDIIRFFGEKTMSAICKKEHLHAPVGIRSTRNSSTAQLLTELNSEMIAKHKYRLWSYKNISLLTTRRQQSPKNRSHLC